MTQLQIKKLVAAMVAAFPTNKITPESVAVYERMLGDLDYAASAAAVAQLVATSRWMPTVAEVRERAFALQSGEVRAGGEEWGSVVRAIGRYGRNRVPGVDFAFSCPVTHEAVRGLGWVALCDSEHQASDRARFVELYDKLAIQARRAALTEALPAVRRLRESQEPPRLRLVAADEPRQLAGPIADALASIGGLE